MSKKIDYLNLSKYLKLPHDRQPAYIGHVNYALDNAGSDEPLAVEFTQPGPADAVSTIDITKGDIFYLDLSTILPSTTDVVINLVDSKGLPIVEGDSYGAKQLWIKWSLTSASVTTVNLQSAKYPLDVTPPFSVGQEAIDAITIQTGVFSRIFCIATLGFDGAI